MRMIEPPGGGEPCVAFSARQFGMTRERLDRAWEAGEPIDPADSNCWIIRKVVAREDGSGDYFCSNRFGGRACILAHAPRPAASNAPAAVTLAPEEYAESGLSARFLDVLFRASMVEGKTAFYRDWHVAIDGDSRPPGGRVSWFLSRKGDGRRLVVRLDLPAEAPAIPEPARIIPEPARIIPEPAPVIPPAGKARRKKGRDDQASFDFLGDDGASGPYRRGA